MRPTALPGDGHTRTIAVLADSTRHAETTAPAAGPFRDRLTTRLAEVTDQLTYSEGIRDQRIATGQAAGHTQATINPGDLVQIRGRWYPVIRANQKPSPSPAPSAPGPTPPRTTNSPNTNPAALPPCPRSTKGEALSTSTAGSAHRPGCYASVISMVVVNVAVESPPTHRSNVDASTTQSRTAAFQYRRSSGPTRNDSVRDCPAARVTR